MSANTEQAAFVLLARQAQVAEELQAVITSIQTSPTWIGWPALALHVAQITRRRHPQHVLPEQVNGYFAEMVRTAAELSKSLQEALLSRDPDKAARLEEDDDTTADLHRHLFSVLLDRDWKHGVTAAVDVTLLSRYYERFADHVVETARPGQFPATGELPGDNVGAG